MKKYDFVSKKPRKIDKEKIMKKNLFSAFLLVVFVSSTSFALDVNEVPGEYSLTGFKLIYNGGTITQDDALSYSGRLSMTTKGFVMDFSVSGHGGYSEAYSCGFYTIRSDGKTINISIKGGTSETLTATYSNNVLFVSGNDYINGVYSQFEYTFRKTQTYYTTTGYTQGQLDQAVAEAEAQKDAIIATLFTQEQLDAAVQDAEAAKDLIIQQKNNTIAQLTGMEDDGVINLNDIIFGLQILTNNR